MSVQVVWTLLLTLQTFMLYSYTQTASNISFDFSLGITDMLNTVCILLGSAALTDKFLPHVRIILWTEATDSLYRPDSAVLVYVFLPLVRMDVVWT